MAPSLRETVPTLKVLIVRRREEIRIPKAIIPLQVAFALIQRELELLRVSWVLMLRAVVARLKGIVPTLKELAPTLQERMPTPKEILLLRAVINRMPEE